MSKPIIGISVDCERDPQNERSGGKLMLNWNYAEAVTNAGGIPILIPPTADMAVIADLIDGWLIPGGNDIDAVHFGQQNHPEAVLQDPNRYDAEKRLYDSVGANVPVLGICYGAQFLNVQRGGDLIQHLPDVVNHGEHSGGTLQSYSIDPQSVLARMSGAEKIEGKSYHHQAVGRVGAGFTVVAKAEDGTVEAIEDQSKPFLIGVQWHPERTPNDNATKTLIANFVAAAAQYKATKGQA